MVERYRPSKPMDQELPAVGQRMPPSGLQEERPQSTSPHFERSFERFCSLAYGMRNLYSCISH